MVAIEVLTFHYQVDTFRPDDERGLVLLILVADGVGNAQSEELVAYPSLHAVHCIKRLGCYLLPTVVLSDEVVDVALLCRPHSFVRGSEHMDGAAFGVIVVEYGRDFLMVGISPDS